jgi:hypothetical protein
MSTRIGPSQLARALGVSRQQVYKYKDAGKITADAQGKFDPDQVAVDLGRNLKAKVGGEARRGDRHELPAATPASDGGSTGRRVEVEAEPQPHGGWLKREHAVEDEAEEDPNRPSLAEAQRRKELANARKAEIGADRLEGKFADLAEVKLMASALVAAAKTRLRSIGNKIAPQIAIESDAASCQAMIDAEVDEALAELAQWEPQAA